MTEKQISPYVQALGLEPHVEGGWHKELWKSSVQIPQELLGGSYSGPRHAASSIYFLLHPDEFSEWHQVLSDELWLWHAGSPLSLRLGGDGDRPGDTTEIVLGLDVAAGQQPQALVPANVWQSAYPLGDEPVLVSCIVAPGFHYDDFRLIGKTAP